MKTLIVLLASFTFLFSFSQQKEAFESLENWRLDTSKFKTENNNLLLWDTSKSGSATVFTSSNIALEATWEITSKLEFAPSNSNNINYILISDSPNSSHYNGYFMHLGESGSDDKIELWKKTGENHELLANGIPGRFGTELDSFKIKVTRNELYEWKIESDIYDGNSYQNELSVTDSSFLSSQFFGLDLKYTSTRFDKFSFNNLCISGKEHKDTIKPTITHSEVISNGVLLVEFSEMVNKLSAMNFSIAGKIDSITTVSNKSFLIYTENFIEDVQFEIQISGVLDLNKNEMVPFKQAFFFHTPKQYETLITELYANPDAKNSLPNAEYIEIYNASEYQNNLENWVLSDLTNETILPKFTLLPDSYLILAELKDSLTFKNFDNTLLLPNIPSLNNNGDIISLMDHERNLIHSFSYDLNSYGTYKAQTENYSLELSSLNSPCLTSYLIAPGGTPGTAYKGTQKEFVLETKLQAYTDSLTLTFNTDSVNTSNSIFKIDSKVIENITHNSGKVTLIPNTPLSKSTLHTLEITNISLCNDVNSDYISEFVITESPEKGDLIISEILFNPPTNGFDYIEIYNNSNKVIDLASCNLSTFDVNSLEEKTKINISINQRLQPQTYYVLTENKEYIINNYQTIEEYVIQTNIPPFNDDNSKILLSLNDSIIIDQVLYDKTFHSNLFTSSEREGKSLERINLTNSGLNDSNWFTSSSENNFGSPTYENSTNELSQLSEVDIYLNRSNVSPDSDGFEDFILLNYENQKEGTTININLYNSQGVKEQNLILNELVNSRGQLKLDFSQNGFNPRIGIHLLLIEIRTPDGNIKTIKKGITINKQF